MRAAPFVSGAVLAAVALLLGTRARAALAPGGISEMKVVFTTFRMSPVGVEMLKRLESFHSTRYVDAHGYSIGYGHFIRPGETFREPISIEQASALLKADVGTVEAALNQLIEVPLYQWQFDALASFAYNVGTDIDADTIAEGLGDSTLLRLLNKGDVAGAAAQFALWNKTSSGGTKIVSAGLSNRREKERRLFEFGVYA